MENKSALLHYIQLTTLLIEMGLQELHQLKTQLPVDSAFLYQLGKRQLD